MGWNKNQPNIGDSGGIQNKSSWFTKSTKYETGMDTFGPPAWFLKMEEEVRRKKRRKWKSAGNKKGWKGKAIVGEGKAQEGKREKKTHRKEE